MRSWSDFMNLIIKSSLRVYVHIFMNLEIKLVQSFKCVHTRKMYVHISLRMSDYIYISIYVYNICHKKLKLLRLNTATRRTELIWKVGVADMNFASVFQRGASFVLGGNVNIRTCRVSTHARDLR
jgi:hypothetical protein